MINPQTLRLMQALFAERHISVTGPINTKLGSRRLLTVGWYERWIPADLTLLDTAVSSQIAVTGADQLATLEALAGQLASKAA